jgi:hypothetical protein
MAYSISGFIFDQFGSPVPSCYYQFLFIKNDPNSNNTTWGDIRQTDINGYYSADIYDSSILDIYGNFSEGDEVLIAYWLGDSTRSTSITTYSDWIHLIVDRNKEHTVQNLRLFNAGAPTAHFYNLPSDGTVAVTYSIINDSTTDNVYTYLLDTFYQHYIYKGHQIFDVCEIKESVWWYGDSTSSDIYVGKHDTSHFWNNPGYYNVTLRVTNYANVSDDYSEQIIIRYAEVIALFIFDPDPGVLGDPVDFTNTSIDPHNRVGTHSTGKEYVWEFYDGDIMAPPTDIFDGDKDFSPIYIFSSFPDRCVILVAYWNDGIEDRTSVYSECIPFAPTCDFDKILTRCSPIYRDRSSAGKPPKVYYWWSVYEWTPGGWKLLFSLEGDDTVQIKYHFPNMGTFKIYHKIEDSAGLTAEVEHLYTEDECPCGQATEVPPGAGGGHWYPNGPGGHEKPKLRVEYKGKKERKKKATMILKYVKVKKIEEKCYDKN